MANFQLISDFVPRGDQPKAIQELVEGLKAGQHFQTLLGVTGSGKTYTIANVIEQIGKPEQLIKKVTLQTTGIAESSRALSSI